MDNLHIIVGGAAGFAIVLFGCMPGVRELRDVVAFAAFRVRVRHIWRTRVANEDIIAITGEAVWFEAYNSGMTPEEAVSGDCSVRA
jgi:hypothetical protein